MPIPQQDTRTSLNSINKFNKLRTPSLNTEKTNNTPQTSTIFGTISSGISNLKNFIISSAKSIVETLFKNSNEINLETQTKFRSRTPSTADYIFGNLGGIEINSAKSKDEEHYKKTTPGDKGTSTNAPARDGSRFLLSLVGKTYQFGVITFVSPYYLLESLRNGKIHPLIAEKLNLDPLTRTVKEETMDLEKENTVLKNKH